MNENNVLRFDVALTDIRPIFVPIMSRMLAWNVISCYFSNLRVEYVQLTLSFTEFFINSSTEVDRMR